MKKLLYCATALAAMFFTACQQENLEPVAGENTVTYTVNVSDVATKAIGNDVNSVNKLYYQVYNNDNVLFYDGDADIDGGVASVNLKFVKEQTFKVLFWAQNENLKMFKITDLRAVTLDPNTPLTSNNVNAQVFAGFDTVVDCESTAGGNVKLVRPISQLNIATSEESLEHVALDKSTVSVSGLYPVYNVYEGVASGDKDNTTFEYGEAAVLLKEDNTYQTLSVNGEEYTYVAMNYVGFAPKDASTTVDVEFTITTSEGDVHHTVSNVPVKPNYRTNIVGDLITESTDYNISLDSAWATEEYTEIVVSTASDLQTTINEAPADETVEISLSGDINLGDLAALLRTKAAGSSNSLTIPAGKSIVLDLNGYSISGVDETQTSFGLITNKGNLTIVNSAKDKVGKILLKATHDNQWNRYSSVISTQVGSTLEVGAGVEIEHLGGTSMSYAIDVLTNGKGTSAVAVIDGATVKSTYRAIRQFLNGTEANNSLTVKSGSVITSTTGNKSIWMQDPSKHANSGSLVVEAGAKLMTDAYLDVTEGSTEWPVSVSIAASALQGEATVISENVPAGYKVELVDGVWTVNFYPVAKIGEKGYLTLNAAVAAVQDGETITLVADEVFTETNRSNNSGYWDGLAYSGDKSFTIDLGGHTIKQDGSLNDYLMWVKNDGAKANTITLKNGTMDAGTTAYSAFATASSNKQTITVNLENINLINNISNGAVVKARGGSVLNVNAGTVITGKNSYVGIEAVGNNTVVNVYEGAEIYQNGTTSYLGAIIGASYNATLNIYGGKGKSAKCGIIVMSTGATINVSGGEWTANGDGTVSNDNAGVLVSQNNRYESGWACKSILNVTGGTFKGGYNCYGMGPGVEADDAQINIKGGNFNANPANYVVAGYEATENAGTYTVDKPAALKELEAALAKGGNVTLTNDVTLLESIKVENKVVLDLNGKTITAPLFSAFEVKAGGELTLKNGKVVAYESTVRAIGGKVIVESGEYTSTGTALDSPATYRYSLDCREGGELIINGGTFKSNNGMINVGSTVTINGGKFENIVEKTMTRHFAYVSAPLTINDGEFYGKANSSAGGCFFCGAAAGGDIQIKGGKFTSLWTSGSVNRIFEVYFGGAINVTGGLFNTNGGITNFVVANTDEATKAAYPYVAK